MCILYNQRDATYTVFFIIISAVHVSGSFSAHHQELMKLCVQPWVLSCFPAVYRFVWMGSNQSTPAVDSRTRMELQFHPGPARKLSTNLCDIYHCWVYSEWIPDDGQRNCPKHVEFHVKIICEISASSWFCYKEICYDPQSHERKILKIEFTYSIIMNRAYLQLPPQRSFVCLRMNKIISLVFGFSLEWKFLLQMGVGECLLLFGAESFLFQFAIQKFKDQDI